MVRYKKAIGWVTLFGVCFATVPGYGLGFVPPTQVSAPNIKSFLAELNEIKKSFTPGENRFVTSLMAVGPLVNEVDERFGADVSLPDVCGAAREYLASSEMGREMRKMVSQVLDAFEEADAWLEKGEVKSASSKCPPLLMSSLFGSAVLSPVLFPFSWYELLFNTWKKQGPKKSLEERLASSAQVLADSGEIPDDVIICAIEAIAIVILLAIPSGATQALAVAIAADMCRRAQNVAEELSAKNSPAEGGRY